MRYEKAKYTAKGDYLERFKPPINVGDCLINQNKKAMEIDIKKVCGKQCESDFELAENMIRLEEEVIEALHIMQSTIENWNDKDCLEFNKKRMIKYFDKFKKDEV